MKRTLQELATAIHADLHGEGNIQVSAVASIASAGAEDLVFVTDEKFLAEALQSKAAAVIAGDFADSASGKAILISRHPKLAFARAARFLQDKNPHAINAIAQSAIVHNSARVGDGAVIDEKAVISEGVEIGGRSRIGAGCMIGRGVKIGNDCQIYPNVAIYPGTTIGDRAIVHAGAILGSDGFGYVRDPKTGRYEKFPQIGKLIIEDDVEIGANTTIDRGALDETRIGRGTKIDNLVHIGHNCHLGENVIIAAQTGLSGSIVIENNVVLGGQVGIGEHARIEEGVMLGGQGGVLPNKVLRGKGVAFWGTPAQPVREYLKQLAALAKLGKKK
jgi:UDP-3-O-[3-hydroxymyristoyl] glucosamine N-acyltransferase